MADNFRGASVTGGDTFAADEISSVKYPRIKVTWGVDGSQVDASASNPFPITVVSELPAGTQNIGNVDIASSIPAGTNNIGDVDILTMPGSAATTDTVAVKHSVDAMHSDLTALTPKFVKISAASSGNNTVLAAVTSKKILVLSYTLVAITAVNVKFQDGAGGTDLTGLMTLATGIPVTANFCPVGHLKGSTATLLNLSLSGSVQVSGHMTYVEVT
jgi:hypothetical protein